MDELKKILTTDEESKKIDNAELLDYLKGNFSNEKQNKLEQFLELEDDFLNDAIEGLKEKEAQNLELTLFEIDNNIKKQLKAKQKNKRKQPIGNHTAIIALMIILSLVIVSYVIIKLLLRK